MYDQTIGSRAQVFHGTAAHTAGGLYKKDLFKDKKTGLIKSEAAARAANRRMKKEGKKAMVKVFKPAKKGDFKLAPKKGTTAYKKLIKKM